MSTTSQDRYCTGRGLRLVAKQRFAMWSIFTPGCGSFFHTPWLFNMLITATGLNLTALFSSPTPAISTLMTCLWGWVSGDKCVCLCGEWRHIEKETERKQKRREKKRRGERERERGRRGKREKCGGSMSASDKSISLPPVGRSERLTLQGLTHTSAHTSLCGYQLCCLGLVNK